MPMVYLEPLDYAYGCQDHEVSLSISSIEITWAENRAPLLTCSLALSNSLTHSKIMVMSLLVEPSCTRLPYLVLPTAPVVRKLRFREMNTKDSELISGGGRRQI